VIIPHKDRGLEWLAATYASLEGQLLACDEVIISDLSEPALLVKIKHFCATNGVTLVTSRKREWNLSYARNIAVRASGETDFLLFVDADVLLPEGYLSVARAKATANPLTILTPLIGMYSEFLPASSLPCRLWPGRPEVYRYGNSNMLVQRKAFVDTGGFAEALGRYGSEDNELIGRLKAIGFGIYNLAEAGHAYHQPHEESDDAQELRAKNLQGRLSAGWSANPSGWGEGGEVLLRLGVQC
jgi:GT2 family glycosyltransferase